MRKSTKIKKLPFGISLTERQNMTGQVVAGVRNAILTGYYQPGDILPSLNSMSAQLGVSLIVVRHAVAMLSESGLVISRQGFGNVVVDPGEKLWKGTVLFVTCGNRAIYVTHFIIGSLRQRLAANGYLLSSLTLDLDEKDRCDVSRLKLELSQSVELVVLYHSHPDIISFLEERGVPYICSVPDWAKFVNCVGSIHHVSDRAVKDLLADVKESGVHHVCQVGLERDVIDVLLRFRRAGIKTERYVVQPFSDLPRPEGVQRAAMEAFLSDPGLTSLPFPDLYVFTDDYVAAGALTALQARGVRVPEDVGVVSFANKGLGPVYVKPVSRIELDPRASGRMYADVVIRLLKGGVSKEAAKIELAYVKGETFA